MRVVTSIAVLIVAALTLFTVYHLVFTTVHWGAVIEWILRGYLLGMGFISSILFVM